MSLATIRVPFKLRRVFTGYFESSFNTSSIGRSRSISTGSANSGAFEGRKRRGFFSSSSKNIPSSVILAFTFLSALQLTPRPTGQEAACLGSLITLTS